MTDHTTEHPCRQQPPDTHPPSKHGRWAVYEVPLETLAAMQAQQKKAARGKGKAAKSKRKPKSEL